MEHNSLVSMQSSKLKRIKGPNEDVWLRTLDDPDIDRNRLDSRRRALLNPDLLKPQTLSCYCGNAVNLEDSWYVMTLDGTLVCNACARCNCCSREAKQISRQLVSIDGLVLCYRCVRFYGYKRYPKLRMRIEAMAMKNPLIAQGSMPVVRPAELSDDTLNLSNSEYYLYNVPRTDRCGYVPKEDLRRPIRIRYYEPAAVKRLPREDNNCLVAPEYLAENFHQYPMLCPSCNIISQGPNSYVVPAMARVFHKRCFRCCNCKESMAVGYKLAGVHFEYCSCDVPMVWCTRSACRASRLLHHKVSKCNLGCLRPGGRLQMDCTSEGLDGKSKRRKRAKQRKESSGSPSQRASSDVSSLS